jgi:hypothetical protein
MPKLYHHLSLYINIFHDSLQSFVTLHGGEANGGHLEEKSSWCTEGSLRFDQTCRVPSDFPVDSAVAARTGRNFFLRTDCIFV